MASTNGSGRPTGCISIPVEIIRDSNSNNSNSHSRHNSPFTGFQNDTSYGGYADSPPWSSSTNTGSNSRFLPRSSPNSAYDRVINNSQFNQPFYDRPSFQQYSEQPQYRQPQQRMYEPGPSHFSRSNEDLLSSPFDSMRYSAQPQFTSLIPPSFGSGGGGGDRTGYRPDSDFVQSSKYASPLRRSFDALNDFPDMHPSFSTMRQPTSSAQQQQQQQQQPHYRSTYQTQHQPQPQQQQQQQQQPGYTNQTYVNPNIVYTDEYGAPTNHYQPNTFQEQSHFSNDRARSPASQRGPSPARTSPPTQTQQQQPTSIPDEPELKMAKDSDGPIPMPAPASTSSPSTADQQVPITDPSTTTTTTAASSPPASEPVRDPNAIALEKLERIKQSLGELEQKVDAFNGSTRNDREYKLLDEQALKIMIRCDELVDVGADIKDKRKEMIRNVQRVISKLEAKVPATPAAEQNSNPMEISATSTDITNTTDSVLNDVGIHSSPPKETSVSAAATEQSMST